MSDSATIQSYLNQAAAGAFVTIPPGVYSIDTPLTLAFSTQQEWMGISAYGVRFNSALTVGGPVLTITVNANLFIRGFRLFGLTIIGGAKETHGLAINCTTNGDLYNFALRDLAIENCNGDGLNAIGNIFEGLFENVCPRSNKGNGATLGNPPSGTPGVMSSNKWRNGSCGQNTGYGIALAGEYYDVDIDGTYFLENGNAGLLAPNGITLLRGGGFENNQALSTAGGPAIHGVNFGTLVASIEGGNNGKQNSLLGGWFNVGTLNLIGCHPAHGIGSIGGSGRVNLIGSSSSGLGISGSVQAHVV